MRNSNSRMTSRFERGFGDLMTKVNSVLTLFEWLITCTSSSISLIIFSGGREGSPEK